MPLPAGPPAATHARDAADPRLRLFVEHAPAAIAMLDRELRYIAVSRRWLADYGIPDADVIGVSHYDVFPEIPARWREIHRRCLAGAVERAHDDPFPRADGSVDWVTWEIRPWRDAAGAVGGILLFSEVVTARKRAELALRDSERRFRALVEESNDLTFLLDAEARITFSTPRSAAVLGHAPEVLLGRSLLEFVEPEDGEPQGPPFRIAAAGGGRTYRIPGVSPPRVVELSARDLLHDPVIGAIVVNGRDVTEQRRLEEEVRQSQKLESVGRLAGGVAHDFNNLLTVILSCAEALGEDVGAGRPASREDVEEISAAAGRAAQLTRQLLAFARRQVIAPRALDLNAAVEGARRLLERLVGEDVQVVVRLAPDLWPVRCDPGQLEQVLLNLVVNARDAMPAGGTITLETANAPAGAAGRGALPEGDGVRLSIADTGHGMSPDVQAHVFEPFFTTKPKGAGTGLGLATVYGIVKQAGGDVTVRSAPGLGTTLDLLFPRAAAAPATDLAPAPAPGPRARGSEAVLLVEDDQGVRDVTARALRDGGYRVTAADGGRRALDLVARGECRPALLVTDVVMPGMDGPTLAAALRASDPGLRVLFVSGYSHDTLGKHGELSSGVELLPKPFTSDALLARVRAVLDSR